MTKAPTSRRVARNAPITAAPTKEQADSDERLLSMADEQVEERAQERTRDTSAESRGTGRASRVEFLDVDGKPIQRRVNREANPFDIPKKDQKEGWDYAWWPVRVQGEQVDPSFIVEVREGGWRPVQAKDMPGLLPPDWDKPFIERGGQVLYMRPMYLTEESRNEDVKIAENQRLDKLKGAMAGPAELQKVAPRQVFENDMHGAVGTARQR